ncbi:MAG TPA: CdaR family protein [Kofleriaceae bacterium]|nr:CdaR family protein [Kofleriaceae bacterium]
MTNPPRKRPDTISNLGRSPARQTPKPPAPKSDPPAEKGPLRRWLHGALLENLGLKFLSVVLAITVFLLVNTDRDREISARIGVSYTMPDDKVLVSERLEEVRVTIKGPYQRMRRFDEREIERINIDLRHSPSGDVAIRPDMISLPAGLRVTSISPKTVHVQFDRRVEKIVEISPQLAGRPLHGYYVSEVKPVPATIKVRGAEGTLAALSSVRTHEVSVEGRAESFVADSEIVTADGVEPVGGSQVNLHVAIDEELVTRKLPGLVVGIGGDGVDPARWKVSPAQVEVTLTGALLAVEKAKAALVPLVKLSANDTRSREVPVTIEGLPPGVGVRISPERVQIAPVKPAGAGPTPSP